MKFAILCLLAILSLIVTPRTYSGTAELILPYNKVAFFSPQLVNADYYAYEFGFVTKKKIKDYNYNAYVTMVLLEENKTYSNELRAGGFGAKGVVLFPTQPWFPLFLNMGVGVAKTSLQSDPWFGRTEQSLDRKDMLFYEVGFLYRYNKFLVRIIYRANNVYYFTKDVFGAAGVNF